jgi:hypothetical protein
MADYINNKQFNEILIEYKNKCNEAKLNNEKIPPVPNEIGKCFILISKKLASKGNFSGYTYKDEMVGDAIENCLMAVHNFDPQKSSNPFAYFTQIIWYAFLRRIEKEKKQTYVKYKSLENLIIDDSLLEEGGDAYADFDIQNEKMYTIIEKFEKKKERKKKEGIETFIDQEDLQS